MWVKNEYVGQQMIKNTSMFYLEENEENILRKSQFADLFII